MEFLELELTTKTFTVFLIEIDDYSRVLEAYKTKDLNVYKFSILNIAEEMIKKSFNGLATEVNENQYVVLINLDNHPQQNIHDKLENVAIQIRDTINKISPFSVTISIGNIHDDISKVYLSYQEALEVIKYKLTLGNNNILFYNDLQNDKEMNYFYPLHIERNMINNVKAGHYEQALHYLEELKKEISERPYLSYENIYRLYSRILDAAINVLLEMNITLRDVFDEKYIIYKELAKRETVDSIHQWLSIVFKKITDYIVQQNRNNEKMDQVIAYMNENYTMDLSLDMIAEQVNLNSTYLSRVFKQYTGQTIVEYLTVKRLEDSKEQLLDSHLNIKEIAQSIGYNNINSYIRYFKKYEGITPGEYRKNYANLKPPRKNA
jgi:two-component system response regulator YesN